MRHLILCLTILFVTLPGFAGATSQLPSPANVRVTDVPGLQNWLQLWVDPNDTSVMVATWQDQSAGIQRVVIGRSLDGGQNWSHYPLPSSMHYLADSSYHAQPSLTSDRSGALYLTVMEYKREIDDTASLVSVYKSLDAGTSWEGPYIIKHDSGGAYHVYPMSVVDTTGGPYDGTLYTVYYQGAEFGYTTPQGIMLSSMSTIEEVDLRPLRSTPVGLLSTQDDSPDLSTGRRPNVVVHRSGSVHILFEHNQSRPRAALHTASNDGGMTFGPVDTLFEKDNLYQPSLASDQTGGPFDGNLYLLAERKPGINTTSNVDFIRSVDGGDTWSAPLSVEDSIIGYYGVPWMALNEEGAIVSLFYGDRGGMVNIYAAYSYDGGATFTANHRITDTSSINLSFLGEKLGIAASGENVKGMWTDYRDGDPEIYTASWDLPLVDPLLLTPDQGTYVFTDSPTFTWATSWKHDQDRYRLEIADDPLFSSITETRIIDTSVYAFDGSLPDGEHYWRVKTFNTSETDSSEYSAVRSILIEADAPTPVLLDHSFLQIAAGSLTLGWSSLGDPSPGEVTYDLHVFPVPAGSGVPSLTILGLTESEYAIDSAGGEGVTLNWYVVAHDPVGGATEISDTGVILVQCCLGETGDVNASGDPATLSDMTMLMNHLFVTFEPLGCRAEANTDGDAACIINLSDLTKLVNKLFLTWVPTAHCATFDNTLCD